MKTRTTVCPVIGSSTNLLTSANNGFAPYAWFVETEGTSTSTASTSTILKNTTHEIRAEALPLSRSQDEAFNEDQLKQLDQPSSQSPDTTFPEGGRQAWLTVLGSFCMMFLGQGTVYSYGVFQDYYTRIFLNNHTPSQIAWIGSMQVFLVFFLGLPAGKLFDEGYFRHLMIAASIIYVFSYFMLSLAKPHQFYQVFLAQGVGVGIGMGLIYVPAISICLHYFKRRKALAVGLATLGSPVGGIVQSIALNNLINGRVGFAWGVRTVAFISVGLAVVGNLLMRTRLPPRKLRNDSIPKPNIKRVVTNIPLLVAIIGSDFFLFGIYFPYFYIQLFAILHGLSKNLAFYSLTILNGATIPGRIVLGLVADRFGPVNTTTGAIACLAIVSFTMIKAATPAGLVLFSIFYGFFSACISLGGATTATYIDNISDLGFAFGWGSFIQSFATLISAPLAGQILDAPRYRWNLTAVIFSIMLIISAITFFVSRIMLGRERNLKSIWI